MMPKRGPAIGNARPVRGMPPGPMTGGVGIPMNARGAGYAKGGMVKAKGRGKKK